MNISYKWLKDYVDFNESPEEIAEKLTMAGITVEKLIDPYEGISGIVVGKINKITAHPDADKLRICYVDIGVEEDLIIVTGAANVEENHVVPVAVIGSKIDGQKMRKAKLRGVESFGMLCSAKELGLDEHAQSGIMILDEKIAPGTDFIEFMNMDDIVLELDLTPNRSDCLGIINVAREIAAVTGGTLKMPELDYQEHDPNVKEVATVTVEDQDLCPRYTARLIKNVKIGESPLWMQHYLRMAGLRPVNNVVDISNFVMLEWGQPLHTFDYDKLADHKIIVRRAKNQEEIITLDDKKHKLTVEDLLICDAQRPICIAGVMGGKDSGVTEETTNVLLETAMFDSVAVRHTSRNLGITSDSAQRFSKGVDKYNIDNISKRAVKLLIEIAGGEGAKGIIDTNADLKYEKQVELRLSRVNKLLGTNFKDEDIKACFDALKFNWREKDGVIKAEIPSYRPDIKAEVDLIEEVARLMNYDKIPTTFPFGVLTQGHKNKEQKALDKLHDLCVGMGLKQIINYDFFSAAELDKLLVPKEDILRNDIIIKNPISTEQGIMRSTILPSMLKTASINYSRQEKNLTLYEVGKTYLKGEPGDKLPNEMNTLGILLLGKHISGWSKDAEEYDYFYMKGILTNILNGLNIKKWQTKAITNRAYLHPGRGAEIVYNKENWGYIGQVHPLVAKNYNIDEPIIFLKLDLDLVLPKVDLVTKAKGLPKFPSLLRDIALVADKNISSETIEEAIWQAGGKYLVKVKLFDIYMGKQIGEDKKSLAYNLFFQADDRTLKDEEVDKVFNKIVKDLDKEHNIKLR